MVYDIVLTTVTMKLPQLGFFVSSDHRDEIFAFVRHLFHHSNHHTPTARRPTVFAVSSDIQRIILVCLQLHDPHFFCVPRTPVTLRMGWRLNQRPEARLVSSEKHHLLLTVEPFVKLPVKFE